MAFYFFLNSQDRLGRCEQPCSTWSCIMAGSPGVVNLHMKLGQVRAVDLKRQKSLLEACAVEMKHQKTLR